jgi:hypothetical protein
MIFNDLINKYPKVQGDENSMSPEMLRARAAFLFSVAAT